MAELLAILSRIAIALERGVYVAASLGTVRSQERCVDVALAYEREWKEREWKERKKS